MTEEERLAAEAAAKAEAEAAAEREAARKAKEAEDAKRAATQGDDAAAEIERLKAEAEAAKAEAEAAKAEAARFKGIDPAVAKENAKKVAEAEEARREAEKKQAEAEGNFERLRELQNEEVDRRIAAIEAEKDAALQAAAQAEAKLSGSLRKAAFAGSEFFREETVLTAAKAERLFGDYVEVENGVVVVYDAPAGSDKRAIVMDAKGIPLPFDQAVKKVFEKDPDRDTLAKTKVKPGGGSKTEDPSLAPEKAANDRISRLAAAVGQLRK